MVAAPEGAGEALPDRIRIRLVQLQAELDQILAYARQRLKTPVPSPFSLRYTHSAPSDILTSAERAQSVAIITRYHDLPDECQVVLARDGDDYRIANLDFLRHCLNDWRPVIELEKHPVHYQRIHRTWFPMLLRKDPSKGMCIQVLDVNGADVTEAFAACVAERNQAITDILRPLEYDYLYNGVLQHSDPAYSKRFLREYISGEFNYVIWKHAQVLGVIHGLLELQHRLVNVVTFPSPGPL